MKRKNLLFQEPVRFWLATISLGDVSLSVAIMLQCGSQLSLIAGSHSAVRFSIRLYT